MIDPTDQLEKSTDAASPRVALAHDWLVGLRGGELVLDQIIRALDAMHASVPTIYTMFDAAVPLTSRIDSLPRTVSALNRFPAPLRRWLLTRYPSAVAQLSQQLAQQHAKRPIDLLISTSSAAIKSMNAPQGVPHLCYCHTPARYLWSRSADYTSGGPKGALRALGLRAKGDTLRAWDKRTADHVDRFIANSSHTRQQIRDHYQREAVVIHPPVDTTFFAPDPSTQRSEALLLVSALEPYKRIDLAISAALLRGRTLNIVGAGSHEKALRAHARRAQRHTKSSGKINFLSKLDNTQLRDHYRSSATFLFPQIEDFGITAVEAQASGCPVIARAAGGALDTVIDNETGAFFNEPNAEALADAIDRAPSDATTTHRCTTNAQRFSQDVFQRKIRAEIADTLNDPSVVFVERQRLINIDPLAVVQD